MIRRGVTLIELLIALVLVSIVGTGLLRILISNSRFVSRQDVMADARQTARAAMNVMVPELRAISDSGLISATEKSIVVRVPYGFGLTCRANPGTVVATVIPTDSAVFAAATPGGMAWRVSATGDYAFEPGVSVIGSSNNSACDADSIRVLPGGRLINIGTTADTIPSGSVFYLYQEIRFSFASSGELPGRVGLWRRPGTGPNEEIAWPFDTSAGFGFLVGTSLEPQDTPPADLRTVRGLELKLVGMSELTARGDDGPKMFDLTARVPFMNRLREP